MKRPALAACCYAALLTVFTGYLALDTFVLPDVSRQDAVEMNLSMFEAETAENGTVSLQEDCTLPAAEEPAAQSGLQAVSAPEQYSDGNVSISLSTYYENSTKIYVADVTLRSAEYLRTAFANDSYGRNIKAATSEIAAAHDAVLAVNGDFYGAQERGIVIRNGVLYRETAADSDILCIYADGTMKTYAANERTAQELTAEGVWQAFSFGPALLKDGAVTVSAGEEVGRAMASNPRTAVGMISPLHYVFVVSDGRTAESAGLSLSELAAFMQKLGVQTAYNLDGGGSSTMYFQGQVVNNPTTGGSRIRERSVSDIVYIGV